MIPICCYGESDRGKREQMGGMEKDKIGQRSCKSNEG